jgi:hypothetical protein
MPFCQGVDVNKYPFSIFKRASRLCYLVAFKDESGKFLPPVSTKKTTEAEAFRVAFQWLQDGIPQKRETVKLKQLSLKNSVRGITTEKEAETVLKELRRSGFLKGYILTGTDKARDLVEFLLGFWDWQTSPYVQEKLRKKHSLHETHCRQMSRAIRQYWQPYFEGRLLGEITRQDVNGFIDSMGKRELSAARKNMSIRAGTTALKWAYKRIDEKLLRKQTGHKTLVMLDHYSNHDLDGDRERIRQAQREMFGLLIAGDSHV